MKKLSIVIGVVLLFSLITISFAEESTESAQTNTSSSSSLLKPLKVRKELLKENLQNRKEDFKEKIASRQAEFKKNLKLIKDENKQALVERINTKIQEVNKNATEKFSATLERLTNLLANFQSESTNEKFANSDKTAFLKQVSEAQDQIASTSAAIADQSEKDYTLTIEDETTLRQTVGQTVSGFRTDIASVYKSLMSAKKEVMDVAREFKKLKGS